MLMQDLYRVLSDNTRITVVTGGTVFRYKYKGLLTNIPDPLLDTHIKGMSVIDFNHLLIEIA